MLWMIVLVVTGDADSSSTSGDGTKGGGGGCTSAAAASSDDVAFAFFVHEATKAGSRGGLFTPPPLGLGATTFI